MTVKLTSNFFSNARGITFADGGGLVWSLNANTNTIAATGTSGSALSSVGLADASTVAIYTVTNSPLIANGTISLTLKTQAANKVFAGPTTGAAAQPGFRLLVAADIPTITAGQVSGLATVATSGLASDLSGTLAAAQLPALTGDVTKPSGSAVTTIAAAAVTLAKMTNLSANSVIGNNTGAGATPVAVSMIGPAAGVAAADTNTFVPTVLGSSSAGVTTYVTQIGRYWRIGGYCFFHLRVKWTAVTGTGNFLIGGLPFTCANTDNMDWPVTTYVNGSLTVIQAGIVLPNTTQIEMDKFTVGTGTQAQALPSAGDVFISGFYPI